MTGICDTLEPSEEKLDSLSLHVEIVLPSSSSIGDLWPKSQHLVALPQGLQRTIHTSVSAVYVGYRLVEILIDCCLNPKLNGADAAAFEHLRPWALDSCLNLWTRFSTWNAGIERGPLHEDIEASYMQSLGILALPKVDDDDDPSSSNSTLLFTTGLVAAVQTCVNIPFSETNQIRLAFLVNELHGVLENIISGEERGFQDRRRAKMKNVIRDTMIPAIRGLCNDVLGFPALHRDLQVCSFKRRTRIFH